MSLPIRLAIADDHPMIRQGVIAVLQRLPVELLVEATDGQDLLDQLSQLPELPHICILDINMPFMNGLSTLQEIRKRWPSIRVIILSMLNSSQTMSNLISAGASGYLLKDGPPEELEQLVSSLAASLQAEAGLEKEQR